MAFFKRKRFHSKKYVKKRRERLVNGLLGAVFVALVIVAAAALLTRVDALEIQEVTILGDSVVSGSEIRKEIQEVLRGSYALVISKDSGLFTPTKEIKRRILAQFPKVRNVDIEIEDFTRLRAWIYGREPYALWCQPIEDADAQEEVNEQSEKCFFLDEGGYIFARAPNFSGHVFFKYYSGMDEENVIGKRYLSEKEFRRLVFFLLSVDQLGLHPVELHRGAEDTTLVLKSDDFESGVDGDVIFNTTDELDMVYDNLRAVIENNALNSDEEKREVEYIDLRFGNKVFYRLKGK